MAEVVANSETAVHAERMLGHWPRIVAVASLAAGILFPAAQAGAQQNGPPTSGNSAAILFVPATLNPVSGFNPANGHLNGGGYGGDGMLANSSTSQFSYPVGMAYDSNGNLFIADESNHVVRRIDAVTGDLSTFAGQQNNPGFYPLPGNSAAGANAQFYSLSGLVVDSSNNIYVADRSNNVVFKITSSGTVTVFAGAGTGACGGPQTDALGDGCPAGDATFNNPWALGIDASNNIYVADSYNDLVREISSSTGKVSIFAGDVADAGSFGDCTSPNLYSTTGPAPYLATQAHLCFPEGIAFDSLGNAYISDAVRDIVRVVNSQGQISTFAGTNEVRSSTGNGGPATSATLNEPSGIYVDPANRVYISDFFGGDIRMVDSTGNINDVMGSTYGELNNYSIGTPDTEPELVTGGQYSGAADGIYSVLMDRYGNILASDSSGDAITSAGTTGQYSFGNNNQIYQTASTTSLNAQSSLYPPYITISNPSNVTLNFNGTPTVTTLTPSPTPNVFAITGGTCDFSGSLAPGQFCTVVVSFTPTVGGFSGTPYTGSIVIDSNSNSSPNTILLSGSGYGVCTYSASLTSSLNFSGPPNVATPTQAATLTNTGVCPISTNVGSAAIINNNPSNSATFTLGANNCPATLNGGQSCAFNVSFTPTALSGYSAQLQVSIPSYGNIHTILNGIGIVAPAVSFNPTPINFPATTDGITATAISTVMTNVGNATLNNIVITLAGANPGYFAFSGTNNCGASLAAGAFCTITVNFTPQPAITNYSAAISVADNAAGSPQTVGLTGAGNAALPPVVVNDAETIHTTDTPGITLPLLVVDNEVIHTTDSPALPQSALVLDNEIIHTTDAPSLPQSALVLVNETIHTTDSPAIQILTSPTNTLLTASTATPPAGNPVTFTATVSSTAGTPTGSVTFFDGATALTTLPLSGGSVQYITSSLSVGSHFISAVYLGNGEFVTSTSNTLSETVTDFTITLTSPLILVILPGNTGIATFTGTPPSQGYTATINWGDTGLPSGYTATFNPNPTTMSGSPVTTTLTITVPLTSISQAQPSRPGPGQNRTILLLGLLLPLFGMRRALKRRAWRLLALALVSIGICMGVGSCGGPFFTQPQQSYTVTVTATSGANQHSTTVDLIVP